MNHKPIYKVLDSNGRVYIPKWMRESIEVDRGEIVRLTLAQGGLQVQKVHLIEVGDQSPEAVEAYIHAAIGAMPADRQVELASRLLNQLRKENHS